MKKIGIVVALVSLLAMLFIVPMAHAASTATITITATGSEVAISLDTSSWAIGTVHASDTKVGDLADADADEITLTNDGSEAVDVTIAGYSMKNSSGATVTWTLSDTATAGAATIGMNAALENASPSWLVIKNVGAGSLSKVTNASTGLAAAGTQKFGLQFLAPTSGVGNSPMKMVGSGGTVGDGDAGLLLTGSIH